MSDLTADEQANVRTALRYLKSRCGMWKTLATLLHCDRRTLYRVVGGGDTVVASLAVRVAKFANVPVDDVISGRFPAVGTCPHCGHLATNAEPSATRGDRRA
jgi:hypothetical protein